MNIQTLDRCLSSAASGCLLLTLVLAAVSCDSGSIDTTLAAAPLPAAQASVAPATDRPAAAYFGDEYAEAQKALQHQPQDTPAPTF